MGPQKHGILLRILYILLTFCVLLSYCVIDDHLLKTASNNISSQSQLNSNEVAVEPIKGVYLQEVANLIASSFRRFSNEELGVTALQEIYDSLEFESAGKDDKKKVIELSERLQLKFSKYASILMESRSSIEQFLRRKIVAPRSTAFPCCDIIEANSVYNEQYGSKTPKSFNCETSQTHMGTFGFDPGTNLTRLFSSNAKSVPTIKWQYFISSAELYEKSFEQLFHQSVPCKQYDSARHSGVYYSTMQPFSKNVIIIVDHGNSLSKNQLNLAKSISKQIISTLSFTDKIGVIGLAEETSVPNSLTCLESSMPYATPETKFMFTRFIDSLTKSKGSTNHSLGLKQCFNMVEGAISGSDQDVVVIYVSRGLLSSLEEAKLVLETISRGHQKVNPHIIINTCAVLDDGKPMMIEKQFLQDIADQNYRKYNISGPANVLPGIMQFVNSSTTFTSVISNFFSSLNISKSREPTFSMPSWDLYGKGLVMSLSVPCVYLNQVVGVVGMDIQLSDILEDVTYFNNYGATYAFMINENGLTVMHTTFPRPVVAIEQPMYVDIEYLENNSDFPYVRKAILSNSSGFYSLVTKKKQPNASEKEVLQYTWQHVIGSPYIIVIVSMNKGRPIRTLHKVSLPSRSSSLVYHRLDLLTNPSKFNLCRHLRQLATLDTGTLFLSASCFQSPFEHIVHEDISPLSVKSYMAYINDNTKLLANPGLKPSIRNDVAAIVQVMPYWKKHFRNSLLNKYVVRSYAATPSGIFQMYPGSVLNHKFDPTRRAWYTRALEFPGKVVLTAPYLDVGGAGYIVTISHTVFEGKAEAMHSSSDTIMAVLGLDFTLGFLYKFLVNNMPFCEEKNIKCFILDDKGYLLAHPSLIDPNGKGPAEQQHITHKEPLVANDILNHAGFVTKMLCNSFSDRTLQRFYQFNTSLTSVLTNLVHGEHCSKYQIAAVPGTNVFVGVVNATCDVFTAFCPCSMTDRLCLNCNRMEQTECECPCECSLEMDLCSGKLARKDASNPTCSHFPEPPRPAVLAEAVDASLAPCFSHNCEAYTSQGECFGVLGCEWCQLDSNEETPLESPFCTHQAKCFNGVLGSVTPYGDSVLERQPSESSGTYKTTPVGPVAGGMVGLILIVGLVMYCYRHIGHRGSRHAYMSSVPDTAVRMSTLDNEMDELDEVDDIHSQEEPDTNKQNMLVYRQELPTSPYRVSTNYRRPPGCDSDHGYSTMTPHDDSEHLPCAEPLLFGKDFHVLSCNNPSGSPPPTTTQLPSRHQVLAPVTVHMVDTI